MKKLIQLLSKLLDFLAAVLGALERLVGMLIGALLGCLANIMLWQEYAGEFRFSPVGDLWWKLGPGVLIGMLLGFWLSGLITSLLFTEVSDDASRKR